jgi:hypothetical protein
VAIPREHGVARFRWRCRVPSNALLRVVVVRRGKVKPVEFRLRSGERGFSMFRPSEHIGTRRIIEAVRNAGKQGDLLVAELPMSLFLRLGLRLVQTPGGTPDTAVNALHVEARPSQWRSIALWVRGVPIDEWFNEFITPELFAAAEFGE